MRDVEEFSVGHWSVDRRVPVMFVLSILVQVGGTLWWASAQANRIETHERRLDKAELKIEAAETKVIDQTGRMIRLEEKVSSLLDMTRQIAEDVRKK